MIAWLLVGCVWKEVDQPERAAWSADDAGVVLMTLRFDEKPGGIGAGTTRKRDLQVVLTTATPDLEPVDEVFRVDAHGAASQSGLSWVGDHIVVPTPEDVFVVDVGAGPGDALDRPADGVEPIQAWLSPDGGAIAVAWATLNDAELWFYDVNGTVTGTYDVAADETAWPLVWEPTGAGVFVCAPDVVRFVATNGGAVDATRAPILAVETVSGPVSDAGVEVRPDGEGGWSVETRAAWTAFEDVVTNAEYAASFCAKL